MAPPDVSTVRGGSVRWPAAECQGQTLRKAGPEAGSNTDGLPSSPLPRQAESVQACLSPASSLPLGFAGSEQVPERRPSCTLPEVAARSPSHVSLRPTGCEMCFSPQNPALPFYR